MANPKNNNFWESLKMIWMYRFRCIAYALSKTNLFKQIYLTKLPSPARCFRTSRGYNSSELFLIHKFSLKLRIILSRIINVCETIV
jgi:hypothetical protein